MNGFTARWMFRSPTHLPAPPGACGDDLLHRILHARGISPPCRAEAFLNPRLTHLHDPSLIPDLDKAAHRLLVAVRAGEPIVIYGDYDVDGITATAILYHTLRAIVPDARVSTYVPHRIDEGYGLNSDALIALAQDGAKLVVSVDCGITAVQPARDAKAAGLDLIITDHHHPPASLNDLPDAFAVVHPRRPDSTYPFGELSGAGVAYKLAWRLATLASTTASNPGPPRADPPMRSLLVDLLAFAALGTIADIVPLVDENRVIARFGLVRARHSPFVGLRALVDAAGLTDEKLSELEVGFRLGPRLNAAGRMGHAKQAVELFTTATPVRAREIAEHLSQQNEARRAAETRILDQAVQLAIDHGMTGSDRRAIVLAHADWHAGIVGIVCSRLVERFGRPTILLQARDGTCHGSGRSIDGFDLHSALQRCAHHLDRFGGHTMAAGMHLQASNLQRFADAFITHANENISPEQLRPLVKIDAIANPDELTVPTVSLLDQLAPFGAENPNVRLLVPQLAINTHPKLLGQQGKHLSLQLRATQGPARGRVFRAVAWNWGEHLERFAAGQILDFVLTPKLSTWTGSAQVEFELRDVCFTPIAEQPALSAHGSGLSQTLPATA